MRDFFFFLVLLKKWNSTESVGKSEKATGKEGLVKGWMNSYGGGGSAPNYWKKCGLSLYRGKSG